MRAFLAELIGTFAVVFVAAGTVCMDAITGGHLGLTGVALAYGFAYGAMVRALGPASGGHLNPAVTLGLYVAKRLDTIRAIGYFLAQLLGAALAALFLRALLHNFDIVNNAPFLGSCDLYGLGPKGGSAAEALGTFLLVTVFFGSGAAGENPSLAGLPIGLSVSALALALGPITGAALNPARAFGPAIASGHWAHHFVYWLGPLVGGAAAGLLAENFLLPPQRP